MRKTHIYNITLELLIYIFYLSICVFITIFIIINYEEELIFHILHNNKIHLIALYFTDIVWLKIYILCIILLNINIPLISYYIYIYTKTILRKKTVIMFALNIILLYAINMLLYFNIKAYMIYIIENMFYFTQLQNTIYLELSIKQYIYILFIITLISNIIILTNTFKSLYKKNVTIKKITYGLIIIVIIMISPPHINIQTNLVCIFIFLNEIITYLFDIMNNYNYIKNKNSVSAIGLEPIPLKIGNRF